MNNSIAISQPSISARAKMMWPLALVVSLVVAVGVAWPTILQAQTVPTLNLASLSLTDQNGVAVSIGTFDPSTTAYTANVARTVTHVTVDASASAGSRAQIYISPKDAHTGAGHHRVR